MHKSFLFLLKNELVFGIGPAGTGKTYLAVAVAVSKFVNGEVDRIVLAVQQWSRRETRVFTWRYER